MQVSIDRFLIVGSGIGSRCDDKRIGMKDKIAKSKDVVRNREDKLARTVGKPHQPVHVLLAQLVFLVAH